MNSGPRHVNFALSPASEYSEADKCSLANVVTRVPLLVFVAVIIIFHTLCLWNAFLCRASLWWCVCRMGIYLGSEALYFGTLRSVYRSRTASVLQVKKMLFWRPSMFGFQVTLLPPCCFIKFLTGIQTLCYPTWPAGLCHLNLSKLVANHLLIKLGRKCFCAAFSLSNLHVMVFRLLLYLLNTSMANKSFIPLVFQRYHFG